MKPEKGPTDSATGPIRLNINMNMNMNMKYAVQPYRESADAV
jgi:hypothetical protein